MRKNGGKEDESDSAVALDGVIVVSVAVVGERRVRTSLSQVLVYVVDAHRIVCEVLNVVSFVEKISRMTSNVFKLFKIKS